VTTTENFASKKPYYY